jgi:hypothetical protein
MNEQIWYVYQNQQQLGPFTGLQVKQMIDNKMMAQDAYLFKVGWKDWRPIEETYDELGLPPPAGAAAAGNLSERRDAAPRAAVNGRVVVHNNGQLVIGAGVNISSTGIFVETKDQIFTVGEKLKLSVRAEGFAKPFNAVAQVVRFNSDPRFPIGYGLRFEELDEGVARDIQRTVDVQNEAQRKARGGGGPNNKAAN